MVSRAVTHLAIADISTARRLLDWLSLWGAKAFAPGVLFADMYRPTPTSAYVLLVVSLICWGSWPNVSKLSTLPFPLFYLFYALAVFGASAFIGLSFGNERLIPSHHGAQEDFTSSLVHASPTHVMAAFCSGCVFNIANVLIMVGVQLVGLTVTFPIACGIGLVQGTVLTWYIEPAGTNTMHLFTGLSFAVQPSLHCIHPRMRVHACIHNLLCCCHSDPSPHSALRAAVIDVEVLAVGAMTLSYYTKNTQGSLAHVAPSERDHLCEARNTPGIKL